MDFNNVISPPNLNVTVSAATLNRVGSARASRDGNDLKRGQMKLNALSTAGCGSLKRVLASDSSPPLRRVNPSAGHSALLSSGSRQDTGNVRRPRCTRENNLFDGSTDDNYLLNSDDYSFKSNNYLLHLNN